MERWIDLLVWCFAGAVAAGGPVTPGTEELRPGDTVVRELAGGETQDWRFETQGGRPLLVSVEQRGTDVEVEVFSGDGVSLGAVDTPTGRNGPEIVLVQPVPGAPAASWRVEVRSPAKAAAPGRYEIRLEELDVSSPEGQRRVQAESRMAQAARLYHTGTAEALRQAIGLYDAAFPLWRALGDKRREAEALFCRGALQRSLGDPGSAWKAYETALPLWRELGDRGREADTLTRMGICRSQLGGRDEALALHRQALEIARGLGDGYREAEALGNIGFARQSQGRLREALASYGEALVRFRAAGDPWQEAAILRNLGGVYDRLGEPRETLVHYRQALERTRSLGDRVGEAQILANLAVVSREMGDFGEALARYEEALALFRALGDRRWEARTLNNIGYAYLQLGETERAASYFEQALELRRAVGDRPGEAITLDNLGRVRGLLGETDAALALHRQALELARTLGDRQEEANALGLLGQARAQAGDFAGGLAELGKAAELLRTLDDRRDLARILQRTGEVQARQGDAAAAQASFEQTLALRRAMADRGGAAETLTALARLDRAAGRLDSGHLENAKARVEEAIGILESLRGAVGTPDLRASFLASQRQAYELEIDLLMELDGREPGRGWARAALEASERSRARSLLELLQESGADVREGIDPELRERERELRQRLDAKATRRLELLSHSHSAEQETAAEREVADLLTEVDRVEAEIRRRSPRYAALTQPQPLRADEIQGLLDGDTLLLEYALGDDRSFLWAVGSREIAAFPLPGRATLETAARDVYRRLRTLEAEPDPAEPAALAALSRILLGPVAAQLPGRRLMIVADGALQYLPFAALPEPTPKGAPLVEAHEVVHLPSASVLAVQRREMAGRTPAPAAVAVLADPVFSPRDPRVADARAAGPAAPAPERPAEHPATERGGPSAAELGFDRLPSTRREAEAIAALLPVAPANGPGGQLLEALDFRASRQTVFGGELGRYRIVHFATHGVIQAETPELSGLVLSLVDERGRPVDGFLGLRDIYNLDLRADLVVLSGCETALGREIRGEGLAGLTRGFMYAGAARVMASLWRVQDRATAELMARFYRGLLADRLAPAAALRQAQIAVRAERRWRDPYYWAPFVVEGDWR